MSQRYPYPSHGAHPTYRQTWPWGLSDSTGKEEEEPRREEGQECYPASLLCWNKQCQVLMTRCSCQSTQVAPVPPNAPQCPGPRLQHTLPSWYYSDPGGHIRRGGAQSCCQAGQDSDLRSAGLASTISCPAPGDVQEAQSWNAGPSELRKRPSYFSKESSRSPER